MPKFSPVDKTMTTNSSLGRAPVRKSGLGPIQAKRLSARYALKGTPANVQPERISQLLIQVLRDDLAATEPLVQELRGAGVQLFASHTLPVFFQFRPCLPS